MIYKSGQIFLPLCHNSRVWRTDGRTDRIPIARPRLHSMQRGKNGKNREPHKRESYPATAFDAQCTRKQLDYTIRL